MLNHVLARGIERAKIFRSKEDRDDLFDRLSKLCDAGALSVYTWAFTGYVVNFNLMQKKVSPGIENFPRFTFRSRIGSEKWTQTSS